MSEQVVGWLNAAEERIAKQLTATTSALKLEEYPYKDLFMPRKIAGLPIKNAIFADILWPLPVLPEDKANFLDFYQERAAGGAGVFLVGPLTVGAPLDEARLARDLALLFELRERLAAFGAEAVLVFDLSCERRLVSPYRQSLKALEKVTALAAAGGFRAFMLDAQPTTLLGRMQSGFAVKKPLLGRFRLWKNLTLAALAAMQKSLKADTPLLFRCSLAEGVRHFYAKALDLQPDLKALPPERALEDYFELFSELAAAGVSAIIPQLGGIYSPWLLRDKMALAPDFGLELCEMCRKHLRENGRETAVLFAFRASDPEYLNRFLKQEKADGVVLHEALLADAEWPNKAFAGRVSDICPALPLSYAPSGARTALRQILPLKEQAELSSLTEETLTALGDRPLQAARPRTGNEHELASPNLLLTTARPLRVAVVGAGPAGLTAAFKAHDLGHEVWLFHEGEQVAERLRARLKWGGQSALAAYVRYLDETLFRHAQATDFHRVDSCKASHSMLLDSQFDRIILACGLRAETVDFSGAEHALALDDLQADPTLLDEAEKILFWNIEHPDFDLLRVLEARKTRSWHWYWTSKPQLEALQPELWARWRSVLLRQEAELRLGVKLIHVDEKQLRYARRELKMADELLLFDPRRYDWDEQAGAPYLEGVCEMDALVYEPRYVPDTKLYEELLQDMAAPSILQIGGYGRLDTLGAAVLAAERAVLAAL